MVAIYYYYFTIVTSYYLLFKDKVKFIYFSVEDLFC